MLKGTDGHGEVSGGELVPQRRAKSVSQRVMGGKKRENRGSATLREAPDSVRDLTRVQYPSRVNGK